MKRFPNAVATAILLLIPACMAPERDALPTRSADRSLESTRAAAAPDVPGWATEAVWYQVFPERFRNGDPSNDPTVDDVQYGWPFERPDGWAVTPWTSDWFARAEWEREMTDEFYRSVQARRYGGDLQGMIDALPYLDSLGVTALYVNPMFEAPTLHKYDGSVYHHIDDNFGPDPVADRRMVQSEDPLDPVTWRWTTADRLFLDFVREAHDRGMKVILDGVFNHMGTRSFVFQDIARNQQSSRFADWIDVTSWDDPETPDVNEFDYSGWAGVKDLPELTEDEHGLIPPIRSYVLDSVRRWMDPDADGNPEDGIDGWRLDVAEKVDPDFWRLFRKEVRSINPEAYLVGEIWWEDWNANLMFDAAPWLQGDIFDAVMNYRWAVAVRRLFMGSDLEGRTSYGPTDFLAEIASVRSDYPDAANRVLMNTLGSHDTDRPASQVMNPHVVFDHQAGIKDRPDYVIRRPGETEWQTLRLMLVQQFTYIGAPHLFYGDEAGIWGGDDPDERKPMIWPDLSYDDEAMHPFGLERPRDPVAFDRGHFAFYQSLIEARKSLPALSRGSFEPALADDDRRLLAYSRTFGPDRTWVVFNLDVESHHLELDVRLPNDPHEEVEAASSVRNVLDGRSFDSQNGFVTWELPARSAFLLVPDR